MNDKSLFGRKPVGEIPVTYAKPKNQPLLVCALRHQPKQKTQGVVSKHKTSPRASKALSKRKLTPEQEKAFAAKLHDQIVASKLRRMFFS